jgi:hypothetical protein
MATAKKSTKPHGNSRAAKMRKYFTTHPTASVAAVAKEFKTTYQVAYMVKKKMEQNAVKGAKLVLNPTQLAAIKKSLEVPKQPRWKTLLVETSNTPITMTEPVADPVNHPAHYKVGGIETIDFIEAKSLGYNLGNVVKYITRSDHKGDKLQDLQKAAWYLNREIAQL